MYQQKFLKHPKISSLCDSQCFSLIRQWISFTRFAVLDPVVKIKVFKSKSATLSMNTVFILL